LWYTRRVIRKEENMGLYRRSVYDSIRDVTLGSINDAWVSYHPEMNYHEFYYALRVGAFKFLHLGRSQLGVRPSLNRTKVWDAETGETWESLSKCAKDLGVSRSAIQLASKRKGRCRGRLVQIIEQEEDYEADQAH
jgi:hypothetical protein